VLEISRCLARQLRAVLRRSVVEQDPRGEWPLLVCRAGARGLLLQAHRGDLAVRYQEPGERPTAGLAFRASLLAEFKGRRGDPVALEPTGPGKGRARWDEGGVPRTVEFDTLAPDTVPGPPAFPREWTPMPPGFLPALAEATQTTNRDPGRFALSRVQFRGKRGEVIATDGRQLLVQGGFPLPWPDTILVPRVPAFGARELADEREVAVGRTKSHVGVKVGPWTFLLAIDTQSRFPDVDVVIPRRSAPASRLQLDPQDAAFLAANLPKLPGGEDIPSVTLDLHTPVVLRAGEEKHGVTELVLTRSSVSGPPVRLCTDRRYLVRAVKLGFTDVEVLGPDKPLVSRNHARVYVWMPLDQGGGIPPGPNVQRVSSAEGPPPPTPPEPERREPPMPAPQPNGHTPDNGSIEPERWGIAEVIAETEALRGLLHDASVRTARLLAALKHQRRRSRAVQQAMQSLKQLQLDR
jgi:hypothetical protein